MPEMSAVCFRTQQKYLDQSAGFSPGVQTSRQYSGVIEHQYIARTQQLRNIAEVVMLNLSRRAAQMQQPGIVSYRQRLLGYQLFRQIISKIVDGKLPIGLRLIGAD